MDHQFFLNQLIVEQEKETCSNENKRFDLFKKHEIMFLFIRAFFLVLLQVNLVRRYGLYPQDK